MSTVTAMYESRFEVPDDEERTLDEATGNSKAFEFPV
jgi:hypothetical protein